MTANTHASNHADTTGVPTGVNSANGPVRAWDNLELKFTAVPQSPVLADGANYQVTIDAVGSFAGFADPRTAAEGSLDPGGPLVSNGSVKGTITYDVYATAPPKASNLPPQEPSDARQGADMIPQLFGGHGSVVGGGSYLYTYNQVDGALYEQHG